MAEKKEEKKAFNPTEQAISDAFNTDFFGYKHWSIEKFGLLCRRRGEIGSDIWTPKTLSAPLRLFVKESKDIEEEKVDVLLNNLAVALALDVNAVKRQFYAIKFSVEDQFLVAVQLAEEKRKKLERLAEEAETEAPTEEETEEEKEEEE